MKVDLQHITICPGSLREGYATYSPAVLRRLFGGKKVSHILPYDPPNEESDAGLFLENRDRISISGVQEKVSLLLDGKQLRLTREGEQGTYLLKPIPRDLRKVADVPANEHLSMQIASQVYGLHTASNALIFFKDGSPAYLTRRFDVRDEGGKWGAEDFASLAGRTEATDGDHYKYDYSYHKIGDLIRAYVPAFPIAQEAFFQAVLFNYLFSNGDAHLKNFSLLETPDSDYQLSPLYDLINTRLHVDDTVFALSGELFEKKHRSETYQRTGYPTQTDFETFGRLLGIPPKRIAKLLAPFLEENEEVFRLIRRSYLSAPSKRAYELHFRTRRNKLTA
jgi:serine/threonine-protein kinase HipA